MSQSPLARSARRQLPRFAHTPSQLAKSTSSRHLSASSSSQTSQIGLTTTSKTSHDTSSVPHTPKITYSPYATSSPHGGLSKSTSIPFDMAGSARAGRKAEQDRARGVLNGAMEEPETPVVRTPRFVRRKPFWQRITSIPEAIIDRALLEYPVSFEAILPPAHFANPISLSIHFLHYLLLAPLFAVTHEADSVLRSGRGSTGVSSRWEKWEEHVHVKGRGLGGGLTKLTITLILLAIAATNTVYVFTRFKTYDMQLRSAQDPVQSPHSSPIPAPKRPAQDEDVFTSSSANEDRSKPLDLAGQVIWTVVKWAFRAAMSAIGRPSASTAPGSFAPSDDKIQSLRVWEPPEICLAFFCAYPPPAPILSYLLTPLHPFLTPLLHFSISSLLAHLATSYAQLVKDRMVLSAEVMREYDRRFVYKRIFGSRVDRGTQTHEAESLW